MAMQTTGATVNIHVTKVNMAAPFIEKDWIWRIWRRPLHDERLQLQGKRIVQENNEINTTVTEILSPVLLCRRGNNPIQG